MRKRKRSCWRWTPSPTPEARTESADTTAFTSPTRALTRYLPHGDPRLVTSGAMNPEPMHRSLAALTFTDRRSGPAGPTAEITICMHESSQHASRNQVPPLLALPAAMRSMKVASPRRLTPGKASPGHCTPGCGPGSHALDQPPYIIHEERRPGRFPDLALFHYGEPPILCEMCFNLKAFWQ